MARRKDDPRGPYIRMHSGQKWYLKDPKASEINLEDIAYHTAGINRYTGGSRFSVAQHMVVGAKMARLFYPDEPLLPARFLIHDASETWYGDVSSPLKSLLPEYKLLITAGDLAVEERFGLTFLGDEKVHELDLRMWLTEREFVFSGCEDLAEDWDGSLEPFALEDWQSELWFSSWSAYEAEWTWLSEIQRYFPEVM